MKILLVGAGPMAIEYAKVLDALKADYDVVGRGESSASAFEQATGRTVIRGGLKTINDASSYDKAIIVVGENLLGEVAREAILMGIKDILIEKPGGLTIEDIISVKACADQNGAAIYVGYNRRYYASVARAKEMIEEDGGVTSFHFEFTEWSHVIEPLVKAEGVKESWMLANSSHIIDLAFYLGGKPNEMDSYVAGSLCWHPSAARFAGAGVSVNGSLFTYFANWDAPGRWGIEVLTKKHRLIFRPLEKLQIQKLGSIKIEDVEINDDLDIRYKPGIYLQVKYYLESRGEGLTTINEQCGMLPYYDRIAGNKSEIV